MAWPREQRVLNVVSNTLIKATALCIAEMKGTLKETRANDYTVLTLSN